MATLELLTNKPIMAACEYCGVRSKSESKCQTCGAPMSEVMPSGMLVVTGITKGQFAAAQRKWLKCWSRPGHVIIA